jgi:hypothetical protein
MKIYIKVSTTTKDFAMKNSNWRLVWQFTIIPRMSKALRHDISTLKVGQICSIPPPGFAICDLGWVLGVFQWKPGREQIANRKSQTTLSPILPVLCLK